MAERRKAALPCMLAALVLVGLAAYVDALPAGLGQSQASLDALEMPDAEMGDAIIAINAQVQREAKAAEEESGPSSDLSLEQEIAMAGEMRVTKKAAPKPDLGESASLESTAEESAKQKAFVEETLKAAQASIEKLKAGTPAEEKAFAKAEEEASPKKAPALSTPKRAPEKVSTDDLGEDDTDSDDDEGVDPVDAMKADIQKQVHLAMKAATMKTPEDPLSTEIDQISVIRKQVKLNYKKRMARREAKLQLGEVVHAVGLKREALLEVDESTPALPPQSQAPPGPPLPAVNQVNKQIQPNIPLARQTPKIGNGINPAQSQVTAALEALGVPAPDPHAGEKKIPDDPDFTKEEIAEEIKKHENYPMTNEELTHEIKKALGLLPPPPPEKPMTIISSYASAGTAAAGASYSSGTSNTKTVQAPLPDSAPETPAA